MNGEPEDESARPLRFPTGIKAVLFDVYGTLLSSTAGGIHPDPRLRAAIEAAHAASPHPFPEVDIREIYARLNPGLSLHEIEKLAMRDEQATNPCTAMAGAVETLLGLRTLELPIGLISNAQFYTLAELERCLGDDLEDLGVDLGLCIFSHEYRRAKPDVFLFQVARDRLISRGIAPEEVIYIGNDVRNDIEPAAKTGFLTALFAGDLESLRLRGKSLDECGADLILANLRHLLSIMA